MSTNIVLFGEAGVGKNSIINLLAGGVTAKTSTSPQGRTLRSHQYTFTLVGKTFNIWVTIGLGEPTFGVSNALGPIEEMYVLIRQIEQQGGLHLLLYCIRGGSRITQTTIHNYQLFFEVLCDKRIPIAVVVTHLESEEPMEGWWSRNKVHITRCGLEFDGHACVTGLSWHPQAAQSRAALKSLFIDLDPGGNHRTPLSSDSVSKFLERLSILTGMDTSKNKHNKVKELERSLRNLRMTDSVTANQLTWDPTRILESSSSDPCPVSLPLCGLLVTPPLFLTNRLRVIFRSSFPIHDDDIVVFLVGPSGSEKSTFMQTVAHAHGSADLKPTLQPSARKVLAIRCPLTERGQIVLGAEGQRNIVFVDTPSFSTDPEEDMKAVHEMSTWLKRSKSKSTRFGTIYLHPIENRVVYGSYRVQRQLDAFAGTFPPDSADHAFPQRLRCVFSSHSKVNTKITNHKETLENELNRLRVVNRRRRWDTSIHPDLFVEGDLDTASKVVEALFSP